jgi:hypothetical protein
VDEIYKLQEQIPELYATENVPADRKIIYQRYHFPGPIIRGDAIYDGRGFNWLLAELDRKEDLAYGWANLNNDELSEWGYICIPDLFDIGAVRDRSWKPLPFKEARELVYAYRKEVRPDHE